MALPSVVASLEQYHTIPGITKGVAKLMTMSYFLSFALIFWAVKRLLQLWLRTPFFCGCGPCVSNNIISGSSCSQNLITETSNKVVAD